MKFTTPFEVKSLRTLKPGDLARCAHIDGFCLGIIQTNAQAASNTVGFVEISNVGKTPLFRVREVSGERGDLSCYCVDEWAIDAAFNDWETRKGSPWKNGMLAAGSSGKFLFAQGPQDDDPCYINLETFEFTDSYPQELGFVCEQWSLMLPTRAHDRDVLFSVGAK